jgi:hypothetical protein
MPMCDCNGPCDRGEPRVRILVSRFLACRSIFTDSPITRGCLTPPASAAAGSSLRQTGLRAADSHNRKFTLELFSRFRSRRAHHACTRRREIRHADAHPDPDDSDRAVRPRRNWYCSDRYRKIAAFALPILHHLFTNRRRPERKTCRVLVLSPTRELSGQILNSFRTYGRHVGISAALAIGGVSMGAQVRSLLNGVDVLVATPGRLLDLVGSNALRLGDVEHLVPDEADRMLDVGFIHDIRKIVAKLPADRQTLFFSATMPSAIAELTNQMLRAPAKVAVTPVSSTVDRGGLIRQGIWVHSAFRRRQGRVRPHLRR